MRLLWSLFALNYAEKPVLMKLQNSAVKDLNGLMTSQIKSLFNIMAYFDFFSYSAKEKLEIYVIEKSYLMSVADLSDIAYSLTRLRTPNHSLLSII